LPELHWFQKGFALKANDQATSVGSWQVYTPKTSFLGDIYTKFIKKKKYVHCKCFHLSLHESNKVEFAIDL